MTLQKTLLLAAALLMLASCVGALYPEQMYLQHIPTVLALAALALFAKRHTLSNSAFACLTAFLLLHILGARYIYSYVPYDDWALAIFGADLTSTFGFGRNHYDRVVHFAFGPSRSCSASSIDASRATPSRSAERSWRSM